MFRLIPAKNAKISARNDSLSGRCQTGAVLTTMIVQRIKARVLIDPCRLSNKNNRLSIVQNASVILLYIVATLNQIKLQRRLL